MANNLTQTAYADHLRGCADLAIEITARMNIHEDAARQATFATVIINIERHNLFMEPVPRDTKTAALPEPKTEIAPTPTADAQAAASADAQAATATPQPTEAEAEAGARKALKEGVKRACQLLNQAGFTPPLKSTTINSYIQTETMLGKPYADFDNDDLEALIKNLSLKLDTFKHNVKGMEEDAGF